MEITSECMTLIIRLVSDLNPNDDSGFNLRKEAVHILAIGPKRRSELMKRLTEVTGYALFDRGSDPEVIWNMVEPHLEEIAVFREGEEGEPGTYSLKPIFMCEYDPYFKHLTREEHNKLREKYINNRVRKYTRDKKPYPPLNELGPLIENFELVREILLSPALLEILRPLLDRQKHGKARF